MAEGVEKEDHLQMLQKFGCDLIQDYYYAKPMPLDELLMFLESF